VLCGEGTDTVTALVWLHPDHAHRATDGGPDDGLRRDLAAALDRLAGEGGGASQRVERVLVLTEPAALDAGEITDKGYVNQRAVRERRRDHVATLTADPTPQQVVTRTT
jgi:feruloyl-CoA synthase